MNLKKLLQKKIKFKKIWQNQKFRRVILFCGLGIIALAALFFVYNLIYENKVFPHTYIGGTNFGGLTSAEAKDEVAALISKSQNGQLNFTYNQKSYNTNTNDLEVDYNNLQDSTVTRLISTGRTGSLGKILAEQFRSVFTKNKVLADYKFNQSKLDGYLQNIAQDVDIPVKDATIEIRTDGPVVVPEAIGQTFESDYNRQVILSQIGSFDFNSNLPFKISQIQPRVTSQIAQNAIPKTKELMTRHITLTAKDKTYELSPTDVTGLISFVVKPSGSIVNSSQNFVSAYVLDPEISPDKVSPLVDKIAGEVNQEAKEPAFQVSNGKVSAFQIGQTGYELDKTKAISQIVDAITNNQGTLELPVKVTQPSLSSDDPGQNGLTELVGEGQTSWNGSPPNRIHNLSLGASLISGSIVKPGEEFSTLKAIGPVDAAHGFLQELVIKNSTQVVPEYGGGLCQVSTTLFRAVLNSGLKITDRTPHSFRVSYYEPPVGMDATIYDPAPDFKFVNNMSTPILIWATATQHGLDFQIYGTKDGRQISISDPVVGDYVSPPPPVYTESDTMAPGAIRQAERATPGATASFHYKVTSTDGVVLQEETFISKYVPLPDSFLYGPGADVPNQNPAPPQAQGTSTAAPAPEPTATPKK